MGAVADLRSALSTRWRRLPDAGPAVSNVGGLVGDQDGFAAGVEGVIAAIRDDALPFVRGPDAAEKLCAYVVGEGHSPRPERTIPALLLLLGRRSDAEAFIEAEPKRRRVGPAWTAACQAFPARLLAKSLHDRS